MSHDVRFQVDSSQLDAFERIARDTVPSLRDVTVTQ